MKLSVITVNLNNVDGLRKTIRSVVEQTFTEFEYIIVDGNSKDESLTVIKEISNNTKLSVKWISEPDSGVFEAMNKGIRMAKGNYLLFLNSGDFFVYSNVLHTIFTKEHSADFLLGRCNISEKGTVIHTTNPPEKVTFGYLYFAGPAHQSTFIKRELFEKYGYYREDFKYNADVEFWYRTIILQLCTTETLVEIVSDYNTDGISSLGSRTPQFQAELNEIFSNPFLQLFVSDYDAWKKEQAEMQLFYWIKSKSLIYKSLLSIYSVARKLKNR
jgi:glycosyltransferase involved in cell wall biosynthesis